MTALWEASEVLAATCGRGPVGWRAGGVSIDSRSIAAGDLFVALRGPRHDGHAFLADAFARGAAAALVAGERTAPGPLVAVDDTQRGLEALARAARARSRARVLALTGSVGKTGTKEALRRVLAAQAPTHASAASHNNHWGVPLSLARLPADAAFGVFEIGMNHAGEIRELVPLVRPHVALVTWVTGAHLAYFESEKAIAEAKAEIFEAGDPSECAVLPRDNPHYALLAERAAAAGVGRILTFGAGEEADWRLVEAECGPRSSRVRAERGGERLEFEIALPGRHWVMNGLAVLAAVEALGADPIRAAAELGRIEALPGRGRRHRLPLGEGSLLLLDESYNANPASMRAAIAVLGLMPGRRLAALGDMAELGEDAARLHAELAGPLCEANVARVFTCGPLMAHLRDALPATRRGGHATDPQALCRRLREELEPGDVLLVKGSLASGMGSIVKELCTAAAEGGL